LTDRYQSLDIAFTKNGARGLSCPYPHNEHQIITAMKKLFVFFLLFTGLSTTLAQDYMINFAGTGDTTVVATVRVDNLTSGATLDLNGDDLLHLIAPTGVGPDYSDHRSLEIFPNPMDDQALLIFTASKGGTAILCVADLTGKTICRLNTVLSAGRHSFRLTGFKRGIYLVTVAGDNLFLTIKLISENKRKGVGLIEPVSSTPTTGEEPVKSVSSTIDMEYTNGDQLLFRGSSGTYATVVPDIPVTSKTITFDFAGCMDGDANHYAIVHIGDQTWMAENLNTGVRIDGVVDQTDNGVIEKYCYDDEETNCALHGGLYCWDEAMQYVTNAGIQGICPSGWHFPTDVEWCTLSLFLDPTVNCSAVGWSGTDAGGKIKSTGTIEAGDGLWHQPNAGATNESGFTGFPSGNSATNGSFAYMGSYGYWWSSTEIGTATAWSRSPDYNSPMIVRGNNVKGEGYSLRCIRD